MIEYCPYIPAEKAHALLTAAQNNPISARGIDRRCYLLDDYAVLRSDRLKLRNVTTRDDDLRHLGSIIDALMHLSRQNVAVVPILGYFCDETTENGTGYLFEQRAAGEPLYDDAILSHFHVWTQSLPPEERYLTTPLSAAQAAQYLLSRTQFIAAAPQEHFDNFVRDLLLIQQQRLLIDTMGKSNFFYDPAQGFQFIDLDARDDHYYGLDPEAPDGEALTALFAFTPCHHAMGTRAYAPIALDEQALSRLTSAQRDQLHADNQAIFAKCLNALRANCIPEPKITAALDRLKFY